MYRHYADLDSVSEFIRPAAISTVPVSEARACSVTMNDSDERSTDGPCGYPIVTCEAAVRFGCSGARRTVTTSLQVVWRCLCVLGAPRD